ncbi:ECF-type sigma factor [Pseudofulvimonas gallinarii]|uniref:RNA polymerase sigma factor (TIGR02999 family) n=1 Tax=Pseudofulvimonas gallinarii TaxID=634155 RepID=A0A4R3LEU0_9GAMM|nr:ECF-type sigma factor [Pseudofulvimonas gallinarii]TCS98442.1 RNA polymerase sigma factor (TIGR02999 family) [Pseudofulvimonas gallinarii]
MADITLLLSGTREDGRPDLGAVFDQLYDELKRIAIARVAELGQRDTLSATGLVHEAYLKLIAADQLSLSSRKHFFACAARAMRQILIDRNRGALAAKRGADFERITLSRCDAEAATPALLDLDRALDDLEQIDPDLRELVELRYFAGLSLAVIAELRGISLRTAARDWERARTLLQMRLDADAIR